MNFKIAIESPAPGSNAGFGVVVPSLPGCFSGGNTYEDAKRMAVEAIELWCESHPEGSLREVAWPADEYIGWQVDTVSAEVDRFFAKEHG